MKFLFKFPSRGRPNKFKETLQLHLMHLSNKNEYKFIFTFDEDDDTMNNDDIKNFIKTLNIDFKIFYGQSKNKIEAINANLTDEDYDILILIADDMIPQVMEYDEIIRNIIETSENGTDTIIHFNTTRWANLLDVWCIMGKKYYDRFKYIYNPIYKSIFADNEYTEVAQILDRYIFSEIIAFNHNWDSDETTLKSWGHNQEDENIYNSRKNENFDLKNGK